MSRLLSPLAVPLMLSLLLAACTASPPTRYHALTPVSAPAAGGSARMLVEFLPVALPERLNRDEMVLTLADGGVSVREADRWAAPLSDEIRQIVADALWRQNGAADDYKAPLPLAASKLPQYRLALRIERFEAGPGHAALVDAGWTLRRLPDGGSAVCRAVFTGETADTAEAAARTLSAATIRLADAVAESLQRLDRGGPASCP